MKKYLSIIAGACALCMVCTTAMASVEPTPDGGAPMAAIGETGAGEGFDSGVEEVVIEGEPGDTFAVGDLIFEIISEEEMEEVMSAPETRASASRWNITLSGTEMSRSFEVTSSYPWAKVYIDNQNDGTIKFTITKGSETGTVVRGSEVTIAANTHTTVYATKAWDPDTYYTNYTSGKSGLKGTSACRVASTQGELDI